jgi:flagellar hook-length control protein FliK
MADLAFLATQTDSALLAGNATALPANGVATGVEPQGAGAASAFSGMLNDRLKSAIAQTAGPGEGGATPGQGLAATGNTEAEEGNVLPAMTATSLTLETAASSETMADAALAATLLSGESPLPPAPVADGIEMMPAQSITEQDHALLAALAQHPLAAGVPPAAPVAQVTAPGLAQAQAQAAWLERNPLAQGGVAANPLAPQSANPAAVPLAGEDEAAALLAAPVARPISASAQLALARAGLGLERSGETVSTASTDFSRDMQALSGLDRLRLMSGISTAQSGKDSALKFPMEQMLASLPQERLVASEGDATTASLLSGTQRPAGITATAFSPMPALNVSTTVGQPAWANELGQRVSWMANNELREAQLQLHPRSLGAVEVRIVYGTDQQLNVSFSAANPIAREALDASLPRLREMFEQQGLNLSDASVSQESFAEQQQRRHSGEAAAVSRADSGEPVETSLAMRADTVSVNMGEGLLNAYA